MTSNHQRRRASLCASTILAGVAAAAVAALAPAILLAPTPASAQDLVSGTLEGRIVNTAGEPIPGAQVTVTSNSRGFSQTFTTDANGLFRLAQAPVGAYSVRATAPGYQNFSEDNLAVSLGRVTHYDLPMASLNEVAEVVVSGTRRRPSVDFDRATTGVVVDVQEQAERLPVARDLQGIVSLAPQITVSQAFNSKNVVTRPDNPIGDAAISGSSPAENIFYINGMNVTNFRNFLGGSVVPFEFYDQIEIKTGGYSAEYGRSTGGAIIGISRSGSNTFHGGANAFVVPRGLTANADPTPFISTFDEDTGLYTNNYNLGLESRGDNYEGNIWLSGPIWKDRLFFFGFYNPRHFEVVSGTSSTESAIPNDDRNRVPDVYDVVTRKDPFYGGKIDFNLTSRQRFAATWFRDNQNSQDMQFVKNADGTYSSSTTNNYSGGLTSIYNYTGQFTDWLTVSALYGETTFSQASVGELDANAAVFSETAGALVRGNPNLLIATGEDSRKNYRGDVDVYFNMFGDHHVRLGYDKEDLLATQNQQYSGGVYYRYYPIGTDCGSTGTESTAAEGCVRVRKLFNVGAFNIIQQGYYLQDAWNVTDRLSLGLGVRVEDFNNKNASGESFVHTKNQVAPRISVTYDLLGDRSTKISAFYGRYHLPVAGNTNIRGSGGETFQEDFYLWTSRDPTTLVPTLGTQLIHRCLEGSLTPTACDPEYPTPAELRSANLKPQFQDEFIIGIDHVMKNNWRISANLIYRDLKRVLEDANLNNPTGWGEAEDDRTLSQYCVYADIPRTECGSFGNSGYVLINPGEDVVVQLNNTWGSRAGQVVTIPAAVTGLTKAERYYQALEIKFARPWDGKWSLEGSYVLSKSYGNYEGGVNSDTSQTDVGGTVDFDQPGWMFGAYGLLPNHHAHQFKMMAVYQLTSSLRVGSTVSLISPRHYGCIGYFPPDESPVPASDSTSLNTWFCGGVPTPRGSQFKGDWIKNIDVSLSYDIKTGLPGKLQLRADAFNIFNFNGAVIMNEFGETGGFNNPNFAYHTPQTYQQPRYVRLGIAYSF